MIFGDIYSMSLQIDAIFDNGVKPFVPLSLPDKARVRVTVDSELVEPAPIKTIHIA
jgi:hypothetical protein